MAPTRLALCAVLLLAAAACDSASDGDGALLTVTARTPSGEPAAGLDVFATWGSLQPSDGQPGGAAARRGGDELFVSDPSPNPTVTVSRLEFYAPRAGVARVRVFDVAGDLRLTVLDASVPAGGQSVVLRLDDLPAGVYRVEVTVGTETVERYALKTDALEAQSGLAISLGRTDAQGRLVVQDSTRLPPLFDIPRNYLVTDEQGNQLGQFSIDRSVGVVLQDPTGTSGRTVLLRDGGTSVDLTFAP